jgi:hypothetical protein
MALGASPAQVARSVVRDSMTLSAIGIAVGEVARPYGVQLTAVGGTPPYHWSIVVGSAGPEIFLFGDQLSVLGSLSAASLGLHNFRAQVKDQVSNTAIMDYSLTIVPAPSVVTASLPAGKVGVPYNQTLVGRDGVLPYNWRVDGSSALPAGLSISSTTGEITGTPTAAQTLTVLFRLGDALGGFFYRSLTMTIQP